MADEMPMFPKATSMFIHTGNIINWNRLKRKLNQSSTEEVCECIGTTLKNYLSGMDKTELQYVTQLYRINSENVEVFDDGEREEVKITVKVFVCAPQPPGVLAEAVEKVLGELRTNYVETLLLAVSPPSDEEESEQTSVSLDVIKPYWEAMEQLVAKDKVLSLGISDLNKDSLEELFKWAKVSIFITDQTEISQHTTLNVTEALMEKGVVICHAFNTCNAQQTTANWGCKTMDMAVPDFLMVKPSMNQVNLESCCVMPKDLTEYAKATSIQLLTHNDKPVFVPKEKLQETIQSVSTERDGEAWTPQWVLRYSGILKCRGIIKMKGYIFHAMRDHKKKLM